MSPISLRRFLALCGGLGAFLLPLALHAQREKLDQDDLEFVETAWPDAMKTYTGLRYVIERTGHGPLPKTGDLISVLYEGSLLSLYAKEGKPVPFDKSQDREHPFKVRVGRSMVIEGWDEMLQLMRAGEKITLIVPSEMAYGSRGQPPIIPRDAALVFTIEVLKIEHSE